MSGEVLHEFDCERLYKELEAYKRHLGNCKADRFATEQDIETCDAHLERVEYLMGALEEFYDATGEE